MKKYFIKDSGKEVKLGDFISVEHNRSNGYVSYDGVFDEDVLNLLIKDDLIEVKEVQPTVHTKSNVSKDTQKDIDDFFNLLDTHIAAPEKSTKPTKPTESKAIMHKIKAIHNQIDALEYGLHEARKTLDELKDMLKSKQ